LTGLSGQELANLAQVGLATVRRAESTNKDAPKLTKANLQAIRLALETAGVEFIPENGGGPGVRLRKDPD